MAVALKLYIVVLMLWLVVFVQADVAHLGNRRYKGERLSLQRLESEPTPYPAAGYRPDREFSLPHDRPLFPLAGEHVGRPFGSSGFNNLGQAEEPQLTYSSPQPEPRFRSQNRPSKFNAGDEPEEQVFVVRYHTRQPAQTGHNNFARPTQQSHNSNGDFSNDFNSFAEDQQYDLEEQATLSQNGFNNLAEPDLVYGAPAHTQQRKAQSARLRQHLVGQRSEKLQIPKSMQAQSQRYRQAQQQQQQFVNAPQIVYSAPIQQLQQLRAEPQSSRLIAVRKPVRLTDNREEIEIETDVKNAESEEIETTTDTVEQKTVTQTVPVAGGVTNTGMVSYYPASAVGFVQPLNAAAYAAAANYQMVQPFSAAYTVNSPYLPQQYVVAAAAPAGAQLNPW